MLLQAQPTRTIVAQNLSAPTSSTASATPRPSRRTQSTSGIPPTPEVTDSNVRFRLIASVLPPTPDVGSTPGERLNLTPSRPTGNEVYWHQAYRNSAIPALSQTTLSVAPGYLQNSVTNYHAPTRWEEAKQRRLATILAADGIGDRCLMRNHQSGILTALQAH